MSKGIFRFVLAFALYGIIYVTCSDGNMKSSMEKHEVVPDVLSEAPEATLSVTYDGGVAVENGAELTPTQVKNEPLVMWEPDSDAFYTIMMVSPDAPSREEPKMKELQNWIVINIPGNDVSKGDILTEYVGAGPPKGTGLHRYIFLLYKQPSNMGFDEERLTKTTSKGRFHFSTKNFVQKYNLGKPIAGNFFQAQYDDFVPELHKQLGVIFDIKN